MLLSARKIFAMRERINYLVGKSSARNILACILTFLLVLANPLHSLYAGEQPFGVTTTPSESALLFDNNPEIIPLQEQPFYPDLLKLTKRWRYMPLGRVVGDSPRATLLNFYAAMTQVYVEIDAATSQLNEEAGIFWSFAARQHIKRAEELFSLAVQALDARDFPESVRNDMAEEAAIQLKEILDYVFTTSTVAIEIPNQVALKTLNDQRSMASQSWTIPETTITLTGETGNRDGELSFVFSPTTVRHVGRLYERIRHLPTPNQPYITPGFYSGYIYTPGFLVPPRWYLHLPMNLRRILETAIGGQTLLQILAAFLTLLFYVIALVLLLRQLLHTYRFQQISHGDQAQQNSLWQDNRAAWQRVFLTFPLLPLARLGEILIDDYINLTGLPLLLVTYLLFSCYFIAASGFSFFFLEALGRTASAQLVRWRGGASDLQLRRVSNLIMPVCRVLGGLTAVFLIYQLLVAVGLPSTTVLAFSAVPGLAIGLGASKLLGNLFGGLSIQTDRPVKVGEFCQIGDNLGFVTKIGLRSLEIQTLESRVTIPNAIVDEQTIVNYSRRQSSREELSSQSIIVRLTVTRHLSSDQQADLLHFARLAIARIDGIQRPLISMEESSLGMVLLCHGLVEVQDWDGYLEIREHILLRLEEIVEQIHLCQRTIGVGYDTSKADLDRLPILIREIVEQDPLLELRSCRLMTIAAFSYDYSFRFHAHHASLSAIKDAIDRLNNDLLARFASEGIEIPYPTTVEIKKNG